MDSMIILLLAGNMLTAMLSACLSSRCSKVETPCLKIERDVLSPDDLEKIRDVVPGPAELPHS